MNILAFDIGGTTIKVDVYDETGMSLGLFSEQATQIDLAQGCNRILEQVLRIVSDYQEQVSLDGVAISTAGVVDSDSGKVIYAGYTIPDYAGTDFVTAIGERFQLPVSVENDVNCAALAETWKGAATACKSAVMVTIGTGIGGSLIYEGKVIAGRAFTAGEVGYLPLGRKDWQTEASASSLVKRYQAASGLEHQTGKTFFAAVDKGDKLALGVLDQYLDALSQGLLVLSYTFNPEVLILGGGILARSDLLLKPLLDKLREKVEDERFLPGEVVAASLGNEAGRLGAVANFIDKFENSANFAMD